MTTVISTPMTTLALAKALLVMVLDPKIRAYLEANDPKALEQAKQALQLAGIGDVPPYPSIGDASR